jgi:hypothetical protein
MLPKAARRLSTSTCRPVLPQEQTSLLCARHVRFVQQLTQICLSILPRPQSTWPSALPETISESATNIGHNIDQVIAAKVAADPTLQDDYNRRDQLSQVIRDARAELNDVQARIAAKEGLEVQDARLLQGFAALTPQQRLAFVRRTGGPGVPRL